MSEYTQSKTFLLCVLQGIFYLKDKLNKWTTLLGYKKQLIASLTQNTYFLLWTKMRKRMNKRTVRKTLRDGFVCLARQHLPLLGSACYPVASYWDSAETSVRFASVWLQLLLSVQWTYRGVWDELLRRTRASEDKENRLMRLQLSRKEETQKVWENLAIHLGAAHGEASYRVTVCRSYSSRDAPQLLCASLPSRWFPKDQDVSLSNKLLEFHPKD